MKIKSTRQFRTLYKNEIREIDSTNRNENFVGVRTEIDNNSQYGFFEIYHGDKEGFNASDGIRGFLEGFLDMAKDGQAVYEFMQNAVDAGSTKFCLFWGHDDIDNNNYLMVVNNGTMFSMDNIRSILNVGVSTKSSNNFTIGKFGIGFKLAHRLVGRENGLDELIHQNYGPILFSWKNNEIMQLEKFIENPVVIPCEQEYKVFSDNGKRRATLSTDDPWLFKILITNFPCQPENSLEPEIILDCQYKQTENAFSKNELKALGRWVHGRSDYFKNDFKEGALFFIRLGQGKQSHLEEENLEEGVKFSLAILNKIAKKSLNLEGLKTVNLRDKVLSPVQLEFESFIISKTENTNEYRFLRFGKSENLSDVELSKEFADSDIEILLGFTDFKKAKEAFLNAPNFYLFFPLSEEKHRLRFILHSNAFYKSSSRTYLQKGSVGEEGINERLFRVFVEKLKDRMLKWADSKKENEKEKFLKLYANLLLSDASMNPERVWVNEPLWQPILNFIENNIPTKEISTKSFSLVSDISNVRIKDTSLPVDEENWLDDSVEWFFWDSSEEELCTEASNKLRIDRFTIVDLLLSENIADKLNGWLKRTSYAQVPVILQELNSSTLLKQPDIFWNNLGLLRIWEFEDGFFSIEEIGDESQYSNRLIIFDTLDSIKEHLFKSGWKLSFKSLSDYPTLFPSIQIRYQAVIKYIRRYEELIKVLNLRLPDTNLLRSEKLTIVAVLAKKLSDDKEDRINKIRELQLFKNRAGITMPLKALLKSTHTSWLGPWVISSEDFDSTLDDYLIANPKDIYLNIIYTYWEEFVERLASITDICSLFEYATGVYKQNPSLVTLSDKSIVMLSNKFVDQEGIFYYSRHLLLFTETEYQVLEPALAKLVSISIPNFELLKYYGDHPFKILPKILGCSLVKSINISIEEAKTFFKLCSKESDDEIRNLRIIKAENGDIEISPKPDGIHMVVTDNDAIKNYIAQFHRNKLLIFPAELKEFESSINLKGTELIKRLVFECNMGNEIQLSILIDIALDSEVEARKYLIDRIPTICFNLNKPLSPDSVSVRFVKLIHSIDVDGVAIETIKKKTTITTGTNTIRLSEIQLFGEDEVLFEDGGKKYSLSLSSILPSKDSNATKIVGQLTEKLTALGVAEKTVLDKTFGLTGYVDKSFIAEQIKEKYTEQILLNAHQLAFVLHYSSLYPKTLLVESFKIETRNGSHHLKDLVTYSSNNSLKFIPDNLVLHSNYEGLSKLLIQDEPVYEGSIGIVICKKPYFNGNRLFIPGLNKIEAKENQSLLIKFIFEKWKEAKEQISNISLGENKNWKDLIGFEPILTVYGNDLIVESEKLPEFVQMWLEESELEIFSKEKFDFLRSLSVSLKGSDIIKVRKFLVGEDSIKPIINFNLPEKLVQNTFELLETRNSLFEIDGSQIELLKELYQRLPDNIDFTQIPVPIIDRNNPDSIIFDKVTDGLAVDEHTMNQLSDIGYEIHKLPEDAGKSIIYASLFRDVANLKKYFDMIQLEFDAIDTKSIADNGVEWNRNFYKQWKVKNPIYKIISYSGNIPFLIKFSGKTIHNYNKNECLFINNEIIVNNNNHDRRIITLIEEKKYLPENVLIQLKDLFIQYDDSIQDFLNRIQSNPKLAIEFEKLKEKEKIEQKKKELTDNFGSSLQYSMSWFMNLLEIMVMSGNGTDLTNPQGNIIFNEIKYDPDDLRLITLKDPSKTISPSIDLFTDFKATFHYFDATNIKRSKKIIISGLSKKGHEVLVIPTNPNDLAGVNLANVREVELTFVRHLELIKKLTNAFRELDFEDDYNLKTELTENINFIFGPPGTGKTTEISRQVIQKINTDQSQNILILTPTNKAADVLVRKILELADDESYPDGWLARFGASTDLELLDRGIVYDGNSFKFNLYDKCVMVTTIQRFPYERVITSDDTNGQIKTRISEIAWDTIIFDEASMIMLPAIVYPLFKRKFKKDEAIELTEFIVGGDPLQIPPIYDISNTDLGEDNEDVKEENIYTMVGLKSFDEAVQKTIPKFGNKIMNLPIQYRSIEAIGTIFSKFQYGGILSHGRNENKGGSPNSRPLPDYFKLLGFKPVTIIRYPVNSSDSIYNPQKLNDSPYHIYTALLLNELIQKFRKEVKENWDIGIIAPYRSQATLLNKLTESHKDKSKLNILTDTVHGFQGGESDLVFAIFNPSSTDASYSRFLKKEFIINVAISRARDYLCIFIPDHDNEGFKKLRLFHESYPDSLLKIIQQLPQNMVANLDAGQIEKAIMGKANYFQEHSFTNVHQDVNIYSDLYRDYIVKLGGNAIDIHLKVE